MTDQIDNVAALEACIGKAAGPADLKVIDHLDEGAREWIAASPLVFAAFGHGDGVATTLGGGQPGFAGAGEPQWLELPVEMLDEPQVAHAGQGFGALFLVPGIGETLRVNGNVAEVGDETIRIAVTECYVHCAKALIRSDFWKAAPIDDVPEDAGEFLAASRFVALATIDRDGRADLSPKGDPSGAMIRLADEGAWFADRPGNRRVDSFRNILAQPHVALAVLLPGSTRTVVLSGMARITTNEQARASFVVAGKTPLLATCIEQPTLRVVESGALARAGLWPVADSNGSIDPAKLLISHVKHSKERGLQARLMRMAVSVPGLMEKGLKQDYKRNLY